ncbi:MAG: peroxiredoxin family protein [Desulfovibrionales bacterium]
MNAPAGSTQELPREGGAFPDIALPAPELPGDREYLGVSGDSFSLSEVDAELILLEIIGVYCPQCHRQAPLFNRLTNRLHRSEATAGRVKVLAFASGATPMEMEYLRTQFQATYPLVYEPDFTIHKKLGEPLTPFTMLIRDGTVVYDHLGVIEDMNALYTRIVSLLP